jgi:hypothetical protein
MPQKKASESAHRVAMSLADRPAPEKDELLRCYEKYIKEAAELAEVTPDQRDAFAYLQVKLVRQIIDGIVASGSPEGGHA